MADAGRALGTIAQLRAVGVKVALDGYGTGHLSMSCLRQMGFDTLKLNRVYVRDLEQPGGDAILRGIIDMAHALNSDVTAKGVARGSQLRALRALGCDAAQGPLLAAPSDATEIGRLVVSPRRAAGEGARRPRAARRAERRRVARRQDCVAAAPVQSARGSGSGVRRAAICSRRGSRNGGRMSFVPSSSTGPSTVKPGLARRELVEHPAGLAEVQRVEVVAVDVARVRDPGVRDALDPALHVGVGRRPGDVVDRAGALAAALLGRRVPGDPAAAALAAQLIAPPAPRRLRRPQRRTAPISRSRTSALSSGRKL